MLVFRLSEQVVILPMGQEILFSQFEASDFEHFYRQLTKETQLLNKIIKQDGCSHRTPVAGFEIEAWLLETNMQPSPSNETFLTHFNNPLAFTELAKFNIELNSFPTSLTGDAFSQMYRQLQTTWKAAVRQASRLEKALLMIGILPTLKQSSLSLKNMSDSNRYRALNQQILHARGRPIRLDITGHQHLKLDHHDVMLEAAATSFQIHIQLPLSIAHHFYNASIIASAPMVAICANAPFLFGKNLWDESRIPLFEQAIETGGYDGAAQGPIKRVSFGTGYARESIMECFTENLAHYPVLLPARTDTAVEAFEHLKLHNGTIWRWNRPLVGFDDDGTPHIRIEHRTPSAGPSLIDMIANAAFFYGLSQYLTDKIISKGLLLPFSQAKDNFYQAARWSLDSHITWVDGNKYRLRNLVSDELIPCALVGLLALGISRFDSENFLDIIRQRLNKRQNGCQWQRQFIQQQHDFTAMTAAYLKHQLSEQPVSEWNIKE